MSNPTIETTPVPQFQEKRERTLTAAVFAARDRHDRCDDFDGAAGTLADGGNVLYCATCRQVLIRWGGGDE